MALAGRRSTGSKDWEASPVGSGGRACLGGRPYDWRLWAALPLAEVRSAPRHIGQRLAIGKRSLRVARARNDPLTGSTVTLARGRDTSSRLSDLHPAGFGHVPRALQLDARVGDADLLVYAAISSAVKFNSLRGRVRYKRIEDRSRRKRKTVRRAISNLERWGYIRVHRSPGLANEYDLLPTGPVLDLSESNDANALNPEVTGRRGGSRRGKARGMPGPGPHEAQGPRAQGTGAPQGPGSRGFRGARSTEAEPSTELGEEFKSGSRAAYDPREALGGHTYQEFRALSKEGSGPRS